MLCFIVYLQTWWWYVMNVFCCFIMRDFSQASRQCSKFKYISVWNVGLFQHEFLFAPWRMINDSTLFYATFEIFSPVLWSVFTNSVIYTQAKYCGVFRPIIYIPMGTNIYLFWRQDHVILTVHSSYNNVYLYICVIVMKLHSLCIWLKLLSHRLCPMN